MHHTTTRRKQIVPKSIQELWKLLLLVFNKRATLREVDEMRCLREGRVLVAVREVRNRSVLLEIIPSERLEEAQEELQGDDEV